MQNNEYVVRMRRVRNNLSLLMMIPGLVMRDTGLGYRVHRDDDLKSTTTNSGDPEGYKESDHESN